MTCHWDKSKMVYCGFGYIFFDRESSINRYIPFNSDDQTVLGQLLYFRFTSGGIKLYLALEENPKNQQQLKKFGLDGVDEKISNKYMEAIIQKARECNSFRLAAIDVLKELHLDPNISLRKACKNVAFALDSKAIVGELRTSINLTALLQSFL